MSDILTKLHDLRMAREQIEALMSDYPDEEELHRMGEAAVSEIGAWQSRITQLKHVTYEDEDAWETMLAGQFRFLMDVIDRTGAPVTDGAMTRLADLKAERQTRQEELRRISEERLPPHQYLGPVTRCRLRARALKPFLCSRPVRRARPPFRDESARCGCPPKQREAPPARRIASTVMFATELAFRFW